MCSKLVIVSLATTLAFVGCSKTPTASPANSSQPAGERSSVPTTSASPSQAAPATATTTQPKTDACVLLTSKEIESVQGEAVKETKLSGQSSGGFSMSQCFFTLPTFTNSVSLLVAQKAEGAGARDPKEFWRDTFHENKAGEEDKERERDKKKGEEEEESTPPQKVTGVGDEAYWTGSRVGGALYVLKGNSYVRISIGGAADAGVRIKKSKALAEKALTRLSEWWLLFITESSDIVVNHDSAWEQRKIKIEAR
jgi:hypothetical protein